MYLYLLINFFFIPNGFIQTILKLMEGEKSYHLWGNFKMLIRKIASKFDGVRVQYRFWYLIVRSACKIIPYIVHAIVMWKILWKVACILRGVLNSNSNWDVRFWFQIDGFYFCFLFSTLSEKNKTLGEGKECRSGVHVFVFNV